MQTVREALKGFTCWRTLTPPTCSMEKHKMGTLRRIRIGRRTQNETTRAANIGAPISKGLSQMPGEGRRNAWEVKDLDGI